jgi:hypothetical protein
MTQKNAHRAQEEAQEEKARVRLSCTYSGDGIAWGPGEVIEVDAAEAARLIDLGVAEAV